MQVQRGPSVLDPSAQYRAISVLRLAAPMVADPYPWREFTVEGGLMNYGALVGD
jgi:hypothetical protein